MRKRHSDLPVAVVGAGAGGLSAATALAENGCDVYVFERGKYVDSASYPTDRFDYELAGSPWGSSASEWRGPVKLQRGIGVGGSTLYFQAVSQMPSEKVLESWGLNSKQLNRYSKDIIDFLQIAGESQPFHSLNPVSRHLYDSAYNAGWHVRRAPVAILSQSFDERPACNYCGLCVYGCRPGDKSSADKTWLPRAKRSGRVKIVVDATVDFIELGTKKRVKALKVTEQGISTSVPISALVMAAGTMETPFLLRNSRQNLAPLGIGNAHVGRNLIGSIWHSLLLQFDQALSGGHVGIPVDMIVEEFVDQGILLCQGRNLAGITGPVSAAKFYSSNKGLTGVRQWMRSNYHRLAGIGGYAESSVAYEDGLLIQSQAREFVKPLRESDRTLLKIMRKCLFQWSDFAGANVLWELGSFQQPFVGAMFRGTCVMGQDPHRAAVDPNGMLHGYENIAVCDASILGKGMIANPSLPVQVLSYYIGCRLAERLRAA